MVIKFPEVRKDFESSEMTQTETLLTTREAAAVTQIPLKEVNRMIDAGLLSEAVLTEDRKRWIRTTGLVLLKLGYSTSEMLSLAGRRRVIRALVESPRKRVFEEDAVRVDIAVFREAVKEGQSRLRKARQTVVSDPGVLSGIPCIKGTRIPVHDVADMAAAGDSTNAILKAYPRLSREQVELAALYAGAYPQRGRPRRAPAWRAQERRSSRRIALEDLEAAS
jgi:uncharacterized protein (DUF433 family)